MIGVTFANLKQKARENDPNVIAGKRAELHHLQSMQHKPWRQRMVTLDKVFKNWKDVWNKKKKAVAEAAIKEAAKEARAARRRCRRAERRSAVAQLNPPVHAAVDSPSASKSQLTECTVCLDADKSFACMPCGHLCMCDMCAAMVCSTGAPCPPSVEGMKYF